MSNAVAKVSFLQGQAWAKAPDGTLRALTVGSTLNDDEVLVTAQGARVELDVGNAEPLVVNGGLEVAMSRDMLADTATETDEALLSDASVQEALTVLEQGGDLLDELEETAAGNTGGGGANDGHSFVQLTRIIEQTDSQAFNYENLSFGTAAAIENDAGYVNRAPEVTDQVIASSEDETVFGQIIANDIEGDQITFTLTTPPTNGSLVLDPATGQFTFTPNANYNGPDSFVVTVTDSRGNSSTTSITLNIAPVNDAPTTNDINLTTDEDTPVNGQVVAQDIENETLSYVVSVQPTSGTVVLDPVTGAFVYTPDANYNGGDSFVVTVSDGNGGTTTSTVTIGINPVNDAPVSNDQNLVTDEDVPVSGQVVASDIDGDTLGYTVTGQPTNGAVTLNPVTGGFVYSPNANYNGGDSFVVTISDGNGRATTSTITIGVNPVNDAPVSSNQNLTTPEDIALTGQVVATDVEGDTLAYSVSGQPTNGTVTLNPATGGFVYTPNANYNGSDSFVVTISDGNGGTTTSTITIGVTPVNDVPVSSNLSLTTPEDIPVSGQVSATDVDGDSLSFSVSGNPANGLVVINPATGSFTYTPNTNYNGSDSFVVTISDGNGGTTTSVVSIGVTPVNDAPIASNLNLTTNENTAVPGSISASDPDGDTLSFSVTGVPGNGTVVLNPATGTFTYTPSTGYSGSDSFVVTISDGKGGTTTSTVNIGVNAVNNAPTANTDTATTDEATAVPIAVRGNDTDPDGDSLTVSGVTQGANGSVVIDAVTGNPIYTPNAGFVGSDSFTYTISDGNGGTATATVNVTVNAVVPVNNAPVATADALTVAEGGTATTLTGGATSVLTNDTDANGDPLTAVLVSGPANGTLTLNPNGTFSYVHNGSETTTDSFTYKVNDGTVDGNTVTVTINVTPVNDAPVANDDTVTVNEDDSVTIPVRTNDTDAEGDSLTVTGVTQGANGSVVIDAVTGNPIYTPNAGYSGSDSFTYTISDGNGGTATATVNVTVNPAINNAPVAVADTFTVAEGGTLTGAGVNVLTNDTDVDGNPLTAILVTGPANGTLTLNADGTFTYVHNGSETTTDSFTYKVNDGTVDGNTVMVTINVTPVNDAPVANDDTATVNEDDSVTIPVRINDTDAEGDSLTVTGVTQGANGSVVIDAVSGNPIYTPNAGYSGSDSFTYTISDGNGGTATATVNVTVNTAPSLSINSVSVNEADGTATFTVTLTPASGQAVSVNYASANGTATAGIDYTAVSGTLNFAAGETSKTITVNIADDNLFEGSENFTISLSNPSNAMIGIATGTGTIIDNDSAPTVSSISSPSVTEGGDLVYSVTLSNPSATSTSLAYSLGGSSAVAADIGIPTFSNSVTLVGGNLIIPAGVTTFNVTVPTVDDAIVETTETLPLTIGGVTATGSIIDNDTPSNVAPVAADDPSSTQLTAGLKSGTNFTWSQSFISSISASGGTLITSNADGVAGAMGVAGKGSTTEIDDEIQNAESILVTFNAPVVSASFGFDKLDFAGTPETGLWIAYLNGVEVGRGQFNPTDATRAGTVDIKDTSGNAIAFNQLKFDTATSGSDYVVSWLTVGRNTATVQEGMSVSIPAGTGVLLNDLDSDGGTLVVAAVRTGAEAGIGIDGTLGVALQGAYGKLTLNADGSYSYTADNLAGLHPGQIAKDNFTYTLSDGQGGTDKATLSISVFGAMNSDNQFYGTAGNDIINGTSGADFISGAAGNDTMTGGLGADTFKWALADKGSAGAPAIDVIKDFSRGQGDALNVSDLLQGENSSNLTNYLHFTYAAGNTTVHISSAGGYSAGYASSATDQTIILNGVNLSGTDQAIINLLKASGNLITD